MEDIKQKDFLALYEPIHDSFIRFCAAKSYKIIELDDLVNESILNAYGNFENLRDPKAFLSFMFSIANNIIKNALRRKNTLVFQYEIDQRIEDKSCAKNDEKYDIEILYKALHSLPELQKEAIILFEINGFSIQEIAEMQQSGISSVKQRLKRGREKLAQILRCPEMSNECVLKKSAIIMNLFL